MSDYFRPQESKTWQLDCKATIGFVFQYLTKPTQWSEIGKLFGGIDSQAQLNTFSLE
jgi:hypothetical protein